MSNIGPSAPRSPKQDQLEYLKGMASAPMGWPGTMPTTQTLDPAEMQKLLERKPQPVSDRPWYLHRNLMGAIVLTLVLLVVILWLVGGL